MDFKFILYHNWDNLTTNEIEFSSKIEHSAMTSHEFEQQIRLKGFSFNFLSLLSK